MHNGYADTPYGQVHFRRVLASGIPVVLLHRTPVSSQSFEPMLRLLEGTRAAIAFDTPGFGQSFRPIGRPTTVDYAHWFWAAIDTLQIERFHLCAHHTGTHFAAEIAVLAEQRVRSLLLNGVLYASAAERASVAASIGTAATVEESGAYLTTTWKKLRGLYSRFNAGVIHAELLGALGAIEGRDQAFGAILSQDFASVLARVNCPLAVVQCVDDPLAPLLNRLRTARPRMPVEIIGAAQTACPELQSKPFTAALLHFAAANDNPPLSGATMSDRRFQLEKTRNGFDLQMVRTERPSPGPSQVLVKVHAASLNRRDLMIRELTYPVFDADNFTPLSDAAGEIVAIGADVTAFAVGDRVCSTFFQRWPDGRLTFPALLTALGAGGTGVLADHVVLQETGVAHIPVSWSFEEGAAVSCAALTAWSGFVAGGGIQKGDWVLVIGTGGVAIFALQMAVAFGANVVMLSSSDSKLARARELGAAVTINYNTRADWDVAIKEATGGGVHHAIELGGHGTLAKSIASMAVGGHIALIGALAGFGGEIAGAALIGGALRISAIVVGSHAEHVAMMRFLVEQRLRPVIDSVYDVGSVAAAYARAGEGAFGKVIIRM